MDAPGKKDAPGGFGRKWSSEFGPYLTLGLQLAISVVAFFYVGRWLDSELGTAPWLMIAGLVVGAVGGFIHFLRTVSTLSNEAEKKFREKREAGRREDRQ